MLRKLIAVSFSLSFLFPTALFLALGKEAGVFVSVGLGYLIISLLAFWLGFWIITNHQARHKTGFLSGLGLLLLAAAFPLFQLTQKYDAWRDQQIIAAQRNTDVFDLRDEPFFSAAGNPLGVRLHFSIRFSKRVRYKPSVRLLPTNEASNALPPFRGLTVLNASVEPQPGLDHAFFLLPSVPDGNRYDPNVTYRFTVDLVPFYLIPSQDRSGFCMFFVDTQEEHAATSQLETNFRIHIDATNADQYVGAKTLLTSHSYNLRHFFDAAVREGAQRPCVWDRNGNLAKQP